MKYWRRVSPRGAIGDLVEQWRAPNPYRWQILGLSVALTFTMMVVLIPESQRAPPARPQVTYISTFAPDRTDAEIVASNLANKERQDELQAQRDALEERKKELYRRLGRATGIDVDAMEAQIEREQAAAAARTESARARATGAE